MQSINLNQNNDNNTSKIPSAEELKEILFVKYKRITVMFMVAVIMFATIVIVFDKYTESEASAQLQYNKYINSLYADTNAELHNQPEQVILPAEGTVDIEKINADIKTAETTIKKIFTFNNGAEYDERRDTMIQMFGEDSAVVKQVFTTNDKVMVDNQEFNYVDMNGINMRVTDVRTYPLDIREDGYNRYMSCVSFTIVSKENANVNYMLSVSYDMDEYGSMVECDVYLLRTNY